MLGQWKIGTISQPWAFLDELSQIVCDPFYWNFHTEWICALVSHISITIVKCIEVCTLFSLSPFYALILLWHTHFKCVCWTWQIFPIDTFPSLTKTSPKYTTRTEHTVFRFLPPHQRHFKYIHMYCVHTMVCQSHTHTQALTLVCKMVSTPCWCWSRSAGMSGFRCRLLARSLRANKQIACERTCTTTTVCWMLEHDNGTDNRHCAPPR